MKMKKMIYVLSLLVTIGLLASVPAFAQGQQLLGDMDGNSRVNSADARVLLRYSAKLQTLTEDEVKIGDMDQNGRINSSDARVVLRIAARLEENRYLDDAEKTEPPTPPQKPVESTEAPTTEAPTTEAPTTEAPTTEAPTTEAPTTEAPTTEAPTTEPPTTEPPTTEPPTTEPPTTEPPTTEPPTTEPPTTEPSVSSEVLPDVYVDMDVQTFDGSGESSVSNVRWASKTERINRKDYQQIYMKTDSFAPGHNIGLLMRTEKQLIGADTYIYMIDYDHNEYMGLNLKIMEDVGGESAPLLPADEMIAIRVWYNLENSDVETAVIDDTEYYVISNTEDDIRTVQYLIKDADAGYYRPAIIENYDGDLLVTRMVLRELNRTPDAYIALPSGMDGFRIDSLISAPLYLTRMMEFMENAGLE